MRFSSATSMTGVPHTSFSSSRQSRNCPLPRPDLPPVPGSALRSRHAAGYRRLSLAILPRRACAVRWPALFRMGNRASNKRTPETVQGRVSIRVCVIVRVSESGCSSPRLHVRAGRSVSPSLCAGVCARACLRVCTSQSVPARLRNRARGSESVSESAHPSPQKSIHLRVSSQTKPCPASPAP